MSEAAFAGRGDAVAHNDEAGTTKVVHRDGRNRRAVETRRKVIAAAKAMISETSTINCATVVPMRHWRSGAWRSSSTSHKPRRR